MNPSKYPSIGQFRNIIKDVQNNARFVGVDENNEPIFDITKKAPTLTFTGTVKLHGTNAGIQFNFNDVSDFKCQSRTNIITPESDNAGFASYVHYNREAYIDLFGEIEDQISDTLAVNPEFYGAVLYGEWCGGSIQKGVGINGLPKMFVVFGIKLLSDDPEKPNIWLSDNFLKEVVQDNSKINLYNIFTFGEWKIDIDFDQPVQSQNILIDYTVAVEKECPVAKYFGIENGTGEGLVWTYDNGKEVYRFKVKGDLHSISKVRTLAAVDIDKVNSINELVSNIVTENRLNQGLDYLKENKIGLDVQNTGAFIKWVGSDIIKEEIDTILGCGFDIKEVMGPASKKAKTWYFENIFTAGV